MAEPSIYRVAPKEDGQWTLQPGADAETETFDSRSAAVGEARRRARSDAPSRLLVYESDGTVVDRAEWAAPPATEQAPAKRPKKKKEPILAEVHPSKLSIAGHPVHPMLMPFPLVFFIVLPILDIAFWATAGSFWSQAAMYVLGAGLIMGGLAALAGLVDFVTIRKARQRAGWYHLLATGGALTLGVVNLLIRTGPQAALIPSGALLSIVTAGLIIAGGWFGGHLTYDHAIGVRAESSRPSTHRPK